MEEAERRKEEGGMWNVDDRSSSHQFEREGTKILELSQAGAMGEFVVLMVDGGWWMENGGWRMVDGLMKKILVVDECGEKGVTGRRMLPGRY